MKIAFGFFITVCSLIAFFGCGPPDTEAGESGGDGWMDCDPASEACYNCGGCTGDDICKRHCKSP